MDHLTLNVEMLIFATFSRLAFYMELDVLLEEKSKELKNLQGKKIQALNNEIGYCTLDLHFTFLVLCFGIVLTSSLNKSYFKNYMYQCFKHVLLSPN